MKIRLRPSTASRFKAQVMQGITGQVASDD
jgi:hypothetical protein